MNLLLNIINKLGFVVDEKKEQIIDVQNHEIGTLFGHDNLITYSFCSGQKITLDKAKKRVVIHVSDNLDIIYKMSSKLCIYEGGMNKKYNIYITLDMHLSNGKSCKLEHYFYQNPSSTTDYESRIYYYNFKYGVKGLLFSRDANNPDTIIYKNDCERRTTTLDERLCNVVGIKYCFDNRFLMRLLSGSSIKDDEAKEIKEIIDLGSSIIDDSLSELIEAFLSYDFSKDENIEYDKIKTFGSLLG